MCYLYTQSNIDEKNYIFTLPMKKILCLYKASALKVTSGRNLKSSHPQLSEKALSIERKTPKIKFHLKIMYITGEKAEIFDYTNIICILPVCRLSVHKEADYNSLTSLKEGN